MRINPTSSTPSLPEMRETRSLIDWLSQVVTLNRALTHPAFPAVPIATSVTEAKVRHRQRMPQAGTGR